MKKIIALVLVMPLTALLCGCCLKHDFLEATCTEPKTCSKCGETEGDPLGHSWIDATCTEPKTCERCGKTKDVPLGHNWLPGDCTTPETCSRCGETNGEAPGHMWTFATVEEPKHCTECGLTEGEAISLTKVEQFWTDMDNLSSWGLKCASDGSTVLVALFRANSVVDVVVYDLNGNELNNSSISTARAWSYSLQEKYYLLSTGSGNSFDVSIRDYSGNIVLSTQLTVPSGQPYLSVANNGIAMIYDSSTKAPIIYINTKTGEEVSEDMYLEEPGYDTSKWSYYEEVPNSDMFFVSTADESQWGFIDAEGNILAMYPDVSNFNIYGYALASDSHGSYYVIDRYFNVVSDPLFRGNAAYIEPGNEYIGADTSDGTEYFLIR